MHIVSATREAEAGKSLEAGNRGCRKPRLCHCTPAWCLATQRDCVLKKKRFNWVTVLQAAQAFASGEASGDLQSWWKVKGKLTRLVWQEQKEESKGIGATHF